MKTKEIHDMIKIPGEDSSCYSAVKKWVADLKQGRGRESTDDGLYNDSCNKYMNTCAVCI